MNSRTSCALKGLLGTHTVADSAPGLAASLQESRAESPVKQQREQHSIDDP